jgi:hypothetical protein
VCLQHGGAGAHDLAAFAAAIAWSTDLGHATTWGRKLRGSDEGTLTGNLTSGVNIEDEQAVAGAVKKPSQQVLCEAMRAEVVVELLAQGVQAGLINVGQEAAEGGAMGELVTPKECHEWVSEGTQAVEECLDGRLTTERITEQDGDEVDDVIVTSAPTSEADILGYSGKDAALGKMAGQQDHFSKPGWGRRNIVGAGVNINERCGKRGHMQLLRRSRRLLVRNIVEESPTRLHPQPKLVAHLVGYR